MDDFPAGPACRGARRPPLSVVIPVHNGGSDLERCLRCLRNSDWTEYELIVVDDGSTDGSADLAASFGARVIRNESPQGPASARNSGVREARGDLVFFVDADVAVHPETLSRLAAHFDARPGLAALFGSYDDRPRAPGVVSQYRNLLHHFVHQQGEFVGECRPAHTFWTGCGAISRDLFLDLGGFDPQLYRRPAIEDIEFGYRMTRAGHPVVLARDVQATHLKRWTLGQVLRTDVLQRGVPWMLLMLRTRVEERDLNVSGAQRLSVLATGAGLAGLGGAALWPWAASLFALNIAVLAACNRDFYRFLARTKGTRFALAAFPLHYLYFVCCGLSVAIAHAIHLGTRLSSKRGRLGREVREDAAGPAVPGPSGRTPRRSWSDRLFSRTRAR